MKTTQPGRRRFKRRAVQIEVTLKFRPPRVLRTSTPAELTLIGRTRDISEDGLSIIVSAGNIDRYLKQKENNFDVRLNLPDGLATFEAMPVHFKRIIFGGAASYIIGSRLVNVDQQQLARLEEFLKSLPS
ncbi:MAG TPA: PilZ domain-containing protein [Pyrinomonadaceae bacterium]|nr:PilZ domain-containing protein [Pyrinomonadaceae bacterium]